MAEEDTKVISDVAPAQQNDQTQAPEQAAPESQVATESSPDNSTLDTQTKAPVVSSKDNSNLKMTVIIVVAIIVALALIGAAYMAFLNSEPEPSVTELPAAESTTSQEPQSEQVDAATIDQETAEIDDIINELDDDADFQQEELDDSNLGI